MVVPGSIDEIRSMMEPMKGCKIVSGRYESLVGSQEREGRNLFFRMHFFFFFRRGAKFRRHLEQSAVAFARLFADVAGAVRVSIGSRRRVGADESARSGVEDGFEAVLREGRAFIEGSGVDLFAQFHALFLRQWLQRLLRKLVQYLRIRSQIVFRSYKHHGRLWAVMTDFWPPLLLHVIVARWIDN